MLVSPSARRRRRRPFLLFLGGGTWSAASRCFRAQSPPHTALQLGFWLFRHLDCGFLLGPRVRLCARCTCVIKQPALLLFQARSRKLIVSLMPRGLAACKTLALGGLRAARSLPPGGPEKTGPGVRRRPMDATPGRRRRATDGDRASINLLSQDDASGYFATSPPVRSMRMPSVSPRSMSSSAAFASSDAPHAWATL